MGALEGSSDTNPGEISPPNLGQPPTSKSHIIVTLDPKKFAEKKQQCPHIGNLQSFEPHILLQKQSNPVTTSRTRMRLDYDLILNTVTGKPLSYPPDTKAFLYYFTSPEKPRIGGDLRLRVASSDDPASFESGSDLSLRTNGRPWSRPLFVLPKKYTPLYEKLREEGLVPDDLDTVLSNMPSKNPRYHRIQILYTLNDTFAVDFSRIRSGFFVITEQGVQMLSFSNAFFDHRDGGFKPYTGSALARFERLMFLDHRGTRTVVLRFLKILTPVKCVKPFYDGFIRCPMNGELYRGRFPGNNRRADQRVWSVDIDKSNGRGLQLLWDA